MRLSSMETFHWHDTTDYSPNQIYGRLRFSGCLDRVAAEQAVRLVMDRQAMLNVVISRENGRLIWKRNRQLPPPVRWHGTNSNCHGGIGIQLDPIDLDNEFPWRVNLQTADTAEGPRSEVWFQASHTVFDGLGATQLIGDWLKFYHQLTGETQTARLHRLNSDDLRDRNQLGLLGRSYLRHLWKQPLGLWGAAKFVCRKPVEFRPSAGERTWDNRIQPSVMGTWLDESTCLALKKQSLEMGVNVNSLLLGELLKTLDSECRNHPNRKSPWVRVILPVSIRTIADRRLPAANRATIVQVDRRAKDFECQEFIQMLDREVGIIRQWELGKLFLLAIRTMSVLPGMLKRAASKSSCRGTAIFANLGEPFGRLGLPVVDQKIVVGNLQLSDFDFVGPIRYRTPINFTIQRHLARNRISLHFDPRVVSADQARNLIEQYVAAIAKRAVG